MACLQYYKDRNLSYDSPEIGSDNQNIVIYCIAVPISYNISDVTII